jgi:signal transduction histidine kinase
MHNKHPNRRVILLGMVIVFAALSSMWLTQQFSITLVQLSASQLLEHERLYIQTQIDASKAPLDASLKLTEITPSRAYFTLHQSSLPTQAEVLAHDTAVFMLPSATTNKQEFATVVMPDMHEQSVLWLKLDLDAALPFPDFLLLLRAVGTIIVLIFAGLCLWLLVGLNHSQSLLHATLKREQDFVNDISHELRTPLAIISNAIQQSDTMPLAKDALNTAKQACRAMTEQLSILLALARNKHTPRERLLLYPLIEQAMFTLYQSEPAFVSQIALDVPEELAVHGHPHLIQLLLLNILSNACYHGNGAQLIIANNGQVLTFTNLISTQPTPVPITTHEGFGHGHSLIKRIVEALNWTMEVDQSPNRYQLTLKVN